MGIFSPHVSKILNKVDPIGSTFVHTDPVASGLAGYLTKKTPKAPIAAPDQDTAANADIQQQQQLLRRRGIIGNVFAGNTASAPTTAAKTALGN